MKNFMELFAGNLKIEFKNCFKGETRSLISDSCFSWQFKTFFIISFVLVLAFLAVSPAGAARFIDVNDGTMVDTQTGLMWTKNANIFGYINSWVADFPSYMTNFNNGSYSGHNDWRYPSDAEFQGLVNGIAQPYSSGLTANNFYNVHDDYYYTGTPWSYYEQGGCWDRAGGIVAFYMPDGQLGYFETWEDVVCGSDWPYGQGSAYIWPVRTASSFSVSTSTPDGHGTVSCNPTTVYQGLSSACTVTPSTGYHITSVSGCNGTNPGVQPNGLVYSYPTGSITGDCTVTATFALNQPPVASFTATPNPAACGQLISFDGSGSYFVAPATALTQYAWNFGDGSPTSYGTNVTHAYSLFHSYTVGLTVTDNNGSTATATATLNVNQGNRAPVANPGGPYTANAGYPAQLNASGSADPDVACGDSIVSYEWDLTNDGTYDVVSTNPVVTISASQINGLGVGVHTVKLRVSDTFGASATATTTLTVLIAADGGSYSIPMAEGTSVLSNSPTYSYYPNLYAGCAGNGPTIAYLRFDLTSIPDSQKIDSISLTGSVGGLSGTPVINAYHVDNDSLGGNTYPGLTFSGFSSYNTLLGSRTITGYGYYTWALSGYNYTVDIIDNVLTIALTSGQCTNGFYLVFNRDFRLDIATSSAPVDTDAPTSSVTSPVNNSIIKNSSLLISGTASDGTGVGVQKVEVSTDDGLTWALAADTSVNGSWSSWTYFWPIPPTDLVSRTILSRATDYAGNQETPGTGVGVTTYRQSGAVYTWGMNNYGQLGIGSADGGGHMTPAQAIGLNDVFSVAAGIYHTAAIKTDNTVWTWGWNAYGQLGDGTYNQRVVPAQVPGLSGVIAIASGEIHTAAVKSDGTVWTWGWNNYGQLGDGSGAPRPSPVQTAGLTNVVAVAASVFHTVALKADGTVWAWGWNNYGQLGDGTVAQRPSPVQVVGLSNVVAIAAGAYHTVALKADGTVWAWGYGGYGQLGDGTYNQYLTPIKVPSLSNVTAITAGIYHTVALKSDGTVWAWGYNSDGELGDGTGAQRPSPVQALGLNSVTSIASKYFHTLALRSDGTIWTWGLNNYGQLGRSGNPYLPGVSAYSGWMDLAGGYGHTIAIRDITAPSSSIDSPVNNAYIRGGSTIISGTATDGRGMGVQKVEVSTDGGSTWGLASDRSGNGSWSSWNYNWVLPTDRSVTLRSRAFDSAGNAETASAGIRVTVDNTPPSTEAAASGGTYGSAQTVSLDCSDTGSGCATTNYCLGSGCTDWTVYTGGTISISNSADLRFYSTDNAGNTEDIKTETYIFTHTLTVDSTGSGNGSAGGGGIYAYNTAHQATASANTGSTFTGWTGDCLGTTSPVDVTMLDRDMTCTATFTLNQHTLSVNTSGSGIGSVGGGGLYDYGTIHNVAAAASTGSTFTGWSGDCSGTTSPLSVTMLDRYMTCTANFILNQHTLTVNATGTGSGTVGGGGTYAFGSIHQVTADVEPGSTFAGWSGDCTGSSSPTSVSMLDRDMTCTAMFADTEAPVLIVSTLSDSSWTSNGTLNVSGEASDNGSGLQGVTVNGSAVTLTDGVFSKAVSLTTGNNGANVITVIATDNAGNATTNTRTINYDPNVPIVTIDQPVDNIKTNIATITISGEVDENSNVTGIYNGETLIATGFDPETGTFSANVGLNYGINTIEVDAEDLAHNIGTEKRTVTYDNLAPSLSVTTPSQDISTDQTTMTIQGVVSDLTIPEVTLKIDSGAPETLTVTNGHFEKTVTFTQEKTYVITVTAEDEAGNSTTVTRNIIYVSGTDTTPDPFTFNSQTGVALNTAIDSDPITVSGINAPATISITDGTYSINGGAFTSSAGTVNNTNTVTVRQTSSASYSATTNATLTIGGVRGAFSLTTIVGIPPTAGVTGTPSCTNLQGSLQDNSTPGSTVTVTWGDGGITTQAAGTLFNHTYSKAGTYALWQKAVNAGYQMSDPVQYSVTCAAGTSNITGTVKSYLGTLIKNALVTAKATVLVGGVPKTVTYMAITDVNGNYTILNPAAPSSGAYTLTAMSSGYTFPNVTGVARGTSGLIIQATLPTTK